MPRTPDSEFAAPLVCPCCGRMAEGDDWLTHPEFGYRRCPRCLDEGLGTVIPRQPSEQEQEEYEATGTSGWGGEP